ARAASLGAAHNLAAAPALAETFTETFDSGSNVGGWTFGTGNPTISYGLFDDGFESGDTSAWSATMP
ncbi:MAG TPA: hypothetical protein VLN08_11425, partial [Vicinamibacterales bacterium]|nr:hypothetical protein [Vicinamibacterales bacterium]